MTKPTLAITGGTGFVGKTLLQMAAAQGIQLRALTRSRQAEHPGIEWVPGSLGDPAALRLLMQGCDAVIHVAGVVSAPDRAGFEAGNIAGTLAMVEAARSTGVNRFVHVSSIAAREADLSIYGWSKAKAEAIVQASGLDWTMIRPPAVYGPGDTELLDMFKLARKGIVPLPPLGCLSLIHVDDLCRLLLAVLPHEDTHSQIYEADDGQVGGWSAASFGKAIGWAFGRDVATIALPRWLLLGASRLDRMVRGKAAKLTMDRVHYLCHPDWTIDESLRPPPALWAAQMPTRSGLKETARAYEAAGWL